MEDNETFSKYAHAQEDGSKFDKYQKLVIKIQNEMNNMLKEICKIQDKICKYGVLLIISMVKIRYTAMI